MAGTEKACSCTLSLDEHRAEREVFPGNLNIVISSAEEPFWQLLVHQTKGETEMAMFKQINFT
jgi:hypothetical protein